MAFDKTGTLTEGKLAVRERVAVDGDESALLRLAAAVEAAFEHPLATAVVRAAFETGVTPSTVEDFESVSGRGVVACLDSGAVVVCSPAFLTGAEWTWSRSLGVSTHSRAPAAPSSP